MDVSQPLSQKEKENEPTSKNIEFLSKIDQDKSTEFQAMDLYFPSNLSDVYKDFNLNFQEDQGAIVIDKQNIARIPQTKSYDSFTGKPFDKLGSTERVEFITAFPTTEIILNIE